MTPPYDRSSRVNRVSIEVSEKLFHRLQAEADRTGDPIDIVAEQAILRTLSPHKPDVGKNPTLNCEGCKRITFHAFTGTRFASGGMEQIYTCAECRRQRRWGLLSVGTKNKKDED